MDTSGAGSLPRKRLPIRPSTEHLKKQAKRRAAAQGVALAEAQHALAREYGCKSWPELMQVVETMQRGAEQPSVVLHEMVREQKVEAAAQLLDQGADVHWRDPQGRTALHHAAEVGPAEMVELLLARGARNWVTDERNRTALQLAREGKAKDKERIIKLLSEIRIDDPHFREAVAAIDAGDVEQLQAILRAHPALATERAEEEGWFAGPYFRHPTLLHFVANNPNRSQTMPPRILEAAQAIIAAGAQVDAVTEADNGGTTLALVASSGPAGRAGVQVALLELLVRNGADPNLGLSAALTHQEMGAVETLLRLGAQHTLASAAGMGHVDALRQLLRAALPMAERAAAAQMAAIYGQVGPVDVLLDGGVDVNARLPHPYGPTLLHQASWYGHRVLVQRLLQRGADPEIRDTQFQGSPADWAEHNKHAELAGYLRDAIPLTKAIAAIHAGQVDVLRELLGAHPQLSAARLNERTLLHVLCDFPANKVNAAQTARALVEGGVAVNATLRAGHESTALHWAASSEHTGELCATLLDLGADVEASTSDDGTTPLTNAMHFGMREAAEVLIAHGAKVSLIIAAGLGDMARVQACFTAEGELIVERGTPPLLTRDPQVILTQALNFAAMWGHDEVVRFLVARGAPINAVDTFIRANATALHRVAYGNRGATVDVLLELGADPTVQEPAYHATPAGWAEHAGHTELAARLRAAERRHPAS